MFEVTVEQTFAAGHALRNYKGKCENVHGHNFKVQVRIEGPSLDETGMLVDFIDVKNDRSPGSPVPERSPALRRKKSLSREYRRIFSRGNEQRPRVSASAHPHQRGPRMGDRNPKRQLPPVIGFALTARNT
jgi:hypothetical protein